MADFSPARCEITKAVISPYGKENASGEDISPIIGAFDIEHGISKVSLTGTITVLDNQSFMERLPLRGEETLDLEIRCYDLQTVRKIKALIYKISDINPAPDTKGLTYTLHWISKTSWNGFTKSIIRAYTDKSVSTIAKEIFEQYISKLRNYTTSKTDNTKLPDNTSIYNIEGEQERKFILQKTEAKTTFTIPRYSASEAMGMCVKRAFSNTQSKSSSFRFFETWDGFYFVSDEWMFERATLNGIPSEKILNYSAQVDLDPLNATEQLRALESFTNSSRVDSARDLVRGAYKTSFIEIDILNHTAKKYNYSYTDGMFKDSTGGKSSWSTDVHTKNFVDATYNDNNAQQFLIVRDYRDSYDARAFNGEKNFRDLVASRVMYNNHLQSTSVTAVTSGRLDLSPGDVVSVRVRELNQSTNQVQQNDQLSGKYLITHIVNMCEKDIMATQLQLFKYDWSDAGSDNRKNTEVRSV